MSNTLIYLAHGAPTYANETRYSLLTAFAFVPPSGQEIRYVVVTDQPQSFADFDIEVLPIDEASFNRWMGNDDYSARMKICILQDAVARYGGKVAFVDTDTYFKSSPISLFERIGPDRSILHVAEGRLSELAPAAELKDRLLSNSLTSLDANPITAADPIMWNSGVIGLHESNCRLLDEALSMLDELRSNPVSRPIHTLEQFALGSVFSAKTLLSETIDIVYHYWFPDLKKAYRSYIPSIVKPGDPLTLRQRGRVILNRGDRPRPTLQRRMKLALRDNARRLGFRVPGARASG